MTVKAQAALDQEEAQHRQRQDRQRAAKKAALARKQAARKKAEAAQKRQEAKLAAERRKRQLEEDQRQREELLQLVKQQDEHELRQEQQAGQAELTQTVTELRLRVQLEQNYLNAEYRTDLAKNKTGEILKVKDQFAVEYRQIMGNPDLVALLEQEAPEVLPWLEGCLDVFLQAEPSVPMMVRHR